MTCGMKIASLEYYLEINGLYRTVQWADSHNPANSPKLAVNHTSFPWMADVSHNWAKKYTLFALISQVRRQSQCHDVRFAGPKKTYFERPFLCHMPVSRIESGPQQLHARTPALIMILKTEYSPSISK